MRSSGGGHPCQNILEPTKHHHHMQQGMYNNCTFDGTIHLPQLFSPESTIAPTSLASSMNAMDILECSQNLLRLTTTTTGCSGLNLMQHQQQGERFNGGGDWSFLDKLLASHHGMDNNQHHHHSQSKCNNNPTTHQHQHDAASVGTSSAQKFPFHYLGCEANDIMKFSK